MANRLVHEVHSLIAFGLPYSRVHARKDAFSQRWPGIKHRKVKHHKYQMFGRTWDFSDPFPENESARVTRIVRWKGVELAEEYMVSVAHDVDDRTWDFEGSSSDDRAAIRKYWESLCAWLVLSPHILKSWARVDVMAGKIHRVVDRVEVWEDEPALIPAYLALRNRVGFLVRRDKRLREALVKYGDLDLSRI